MKTINIMRGYTGLQAFFPSLSNKVQEATPMNKVTIASSDMCVETYRPRVLSQRNARAARRDSH